MADTAICVVNLVVLDGLLSHCLIPTGTINMDVGVTAFDDTEFEQVDLDALS